MQSYCIVRQFVLYSWVTRLFVLSLKYYFYILFFLLSASSSTAQISWEWANELRSNLDEKTLDITTNPVNGETYACGYFEGDFSGEFSMGLNGTPNMSASLGQRDAFVAKYDISGNVIWAFKIGGIGATVEAEAITIGPLGNIYITGEFYDATVNFQGVATSVTATETPTGVTRDMFLASYNSSGELLWVTRSSGLGNSIGFGITTGANGIYVAGRFSDDITFPPLAPVIWSASASYLDGYVAKFDFSGNAINVKTIVGSGDGYVKAFNLVVDATTIYAVGSAGSTTWTFGPTSISPPDNNNGAAGTVDIWVASIDEATFNFNWSQAIGSVENDLARGIAIDATGLYLTGGLGGGSINFPGLGVVPSVGTAKDIFTSKLFLATGLGDWVTLEQNNTALDSEGMGIEVDGSGNLITIGYHNGTTSFNGGANSVTSSGGTDVFVMSRKNTGVFNWVKTAGSTGDDQGLSIGFDNFGGVYSGGFYDLATTFGTIIINSDLQNNGFVARLNSCSISLSCPANQTDTANASCQFALPDYTGLATPVASCGIVSVKQLPVVGTIVTSGVTTISLYLTDANNNVDSCSFNLLVVDTIAPFITCIGNQNDTNDINLCTAVINGIAPLTSGDNCGVDSISYVLTGATLGSGLNDASGTSFNVGITTVRYYIFDLAGNSDSSSFTVTVTDTENPIITCPNNQSSSTSNLTCNQIITGIAPVGITENCAIDSVNFVVSGATIASGLNDASGTAFNLGVSTVTYTIHDLAGNTNTCSFTQTIIDSVAPTITCAGAVVLYTDANSCGTSAIGIGPTTVNDNCAIDSVSYLLSGATTGSGANDASGVYFNLGITDVKYYLFDLAGNVDSCSFTVQVNDNKRPIVTCPVNRTVNNDLNNCSAIVTGIAPSAINDNCGIDTVYYKLTGATIGSGPNDASGNMFNVGITTIKYFAIDQSGNIDSCNFLVTVIDNQKPTISCVGNLSMSTSNAACSNVINNIAPINFSENCIIASISYKLSGASTGSGLNDASGSVFYLGLTTVTYLITDNSGNVDSCSFTVNIIDSVAPNISCSSNRIVNNDTGFCSAVVSGIQPNSLNDNCGVDTVYYNLTGATIGSGPNNASSNTFNHGTTLITYYILDFAGNIDSCSFTIEVIDAEAPSIFCPNSVSISNDLGVCSSIVNNIGPISSSDNCGIDSISYVFSGATIGSGLNDASGTAFNVGYTGVTYIVYDLAGNADSCSFVVRVLDTENPTITCPNDIVVCDTSVTVPLPLFSDNCVVSSVVNNYNTTNNASDIYPYGTSTVNWIVTDVAGNNNTCTMTITAEIPPAAYAGEDQKLYGVNSTSFEANIPAVGLGVWSISAGNGFIKTYNDPKSMVENLEVGTNIFEWRVANGTCIDAYDDVIITMVDLKIPNGFSPNNDGNNDYFEIEGLDLLENELIIFNRWGVELYQSHNYQNDWNGKSKSGDDLPEDTYYYTLKIPSLNKDLSGFIVLKK